MGCARQLCRRSGTLVCIPRRVAATTSLDRKDRRLDLSTPPIEPLRAVITRLEKARIACALGGSGLLAALGLVDRVGDWDVTVEASLEDLQSLFSDREGEPHGSSGVHADHKLVLPDEKIELIARFAFRVPEGIVRIPTLVTRRWNEIPIGSPEAWAVAYAIMGELEDSARRRERADHLWRYLEENGSDPEVVRRLLQEPLPRMIAARLDTLRGVGGNPAKNQG
jgi:hypothetical protein